MPSSESRVHHFTPAIALALALSLLSPAFAHADTTKRLILKDGTYQSVSTYEVKGDRVRYRSADREEWEEIPKLLIDWKATDDFNAGRTKAQESPDAVALDKEAEADLQAEQARTPEVAPGLRLPDGGGVLLLDKFNGEPELVEIAQNGGELNRNTGKNILRGAINPVAGQKQTVELEGDLAKIQAHTARPVIYVGTTPDDPSNSVRADHDAPTSDAPSPDGKNEDAKPTAKADSSADPGQSPDRFRLVRAEVKKEVRVVGVVKIAITGKVSQQQKFIETHNEAMPGGWVKITPVHDLDTGEYALVEMLGKAGMNLYVWDFGVSPKGPENPSAWKATPTKPDKKM